MYSGWHKATGGRLLGKIKIERNTVEETLPIPLYARKAASEEYPELIQDEWARAIIERLDLPQGLYATQVPLPCATGRLRRFSGFMA